jgi:hypothetical protein
MTWRECVGQFSTGLYSQRALGIDVPPFRTSVPKATFNIFKEERALFFPAQDDRE